MVAHEPEPNYHRPFFLVGASRSGTTMFRLMLNAHPDLLIPGETWFLSDLMDQFPLQGPLAPDQVEDALAIIRGHWRWREWGLEDELLNSTLRALKRPSLGDLIDALFSLPSGGAKWGDKTPGYATEIDRLHQVFPGAKFIHVIRDGRDVCTSLKRTGWHGESTWAIAEYWRDTVEVACGAGRALSEGYYIEVAYEELVLNTESTLRSVSDFLEIPFDPGMLSFHETAASNIPDRAEGHLSKTKRPPRGSDVQRWKNEQPRLRTLVFEAFAGSALELAGYERSASHGLWLIRALCRGLDRGAAVSLPMRRKLGLHFPGWRKAL